MRDDTFSSTSDVRGGMVLNEQNSRRFAFPFRILFGVYYLYGSLAVATARENALAREEAPPGEVVLPPGQHARRAHEEDRPPRRADGLLALRSLLHVRQVLPRACRWRIVHIIVDMRG